MADPVKGSNVLLQIYKAGEYRDFLCATDCSISFETEKKSVKTITDGVWRRYRPQNIGYTITLNGLVKLNTGNDPAAFDILDYQTSFTDVTYRMTFEDDAANVKAIFGTAMVEKTDLSGGADGFANSSFTLVGNGEPTILDSLTACDTVITTLLKDATNLPLFYAFTVTAYTGTAPDRYEYAIDGGARQVSFTADWTVTGLSSGVHTIEIWPVCPNGFDGTKFTDTFTY